MNTILEDLYAFQKDNITDYNEYKKLCYNSLNWRLYSFNWNCKYFLNLLFYKIRSEL